MKGKRGGEVISHSPRKMYHRDSTEVQGVDLLEWL